MSIMPLLSLPCEIHLAIIDHLQANSQSQKSLISLSNTCPLYRSLAVPALFRSITLRNKQIGSAARDLITTSAIRHHVKELNFVGSAPGNTCYDSGYGDDFDETSYVLPKTVSSILADLKCFPNLQTLTVEFDFGFRDQTKWSYVPQIFNEQEDCQQVAMAEMNEAWRSLMAKVWNALVQNTDPHFKNLGIRHMVPKEVSTFRKPEFGAFLNAMEHFSLTAHGNVTGERDNTLEGVGKFYSHLEGFIFDHLTNLSHLHLVASERGPLGLTKDNFNDCLPLPLAVQHMPLIQSIHLEGVWVCPDLLNVLASRISTLKSITMRDCMGHAPDEANMPELRWAHLFQGLADASPKFLKSFLIESTGSCGVMISDGSESSEEVEKIRAVSGILNGQQKRRLFAYQYCDEKSGNRRDDDKVSRTAFLRGDDQIQYDRLMKIVDSNGRW